MRSAFGGWCRALSSSLIQANTSRTTWPWTVGESEIAAGVAIGEFLVIEAERIVIAAGHLKEIGSRQLDGGRSSEFSTDEPQRLFRQSLVSLNSSKKSGGSFLDEFKSFAFDGVCGFHSQRALSALLQRGADGR